MHAHKLRVVLTRWTRVDDAASVDWISIGPLWGRAWRARAGAVVAVETHVGRVSWSEPNENQNKNHHRLEIREMKMRGRQIDKSSNYKQRWSVSHIKATRARLSHTCTSRVFIVGIGAWVERTDVIVDSASVVAAITSRLVRPIDKNNTNIKNRCQYKFMTSWMRCLN